MNILTNYHFEYIYCRRAITEVGDIQSDVLLKKQTTH